MIITTHPTMSTSHYPCLWPSQKLFWRAAPASKFSGRFVQCFYSVP